MNLPNKLTVSRFALTAAFLWAMFSRSPVNDTLALVFFSLAGITDYLDGKIARQRKLITNFGILMDPLADKIMTCSAFIAFVAMPETGMKAWMVVVIVARELAIRPYEVWSTKVRVDAYHALLRRSLFVGLSDGRKKLARTENCSRQK